MKKNAIVVGGSSGIGLAIIDMLIEKGYEVINLSRRVCPRKEVKSYLIDVTHIFRYEKLLFDICINGVTPQVLIYSAGYSMAAEIDKVKQSDYRHLFEVNFFAALTAVRVVSRFMKKDGGRIVLISSVGGIMPIPYDGFYSSSKAALDTICFGLRAELERDKIYLTSVLPGGTRTQFSYKRNIYNSKDLQFNRAVRRLYFIEQKGISGETVAKRVATVIKRKSPPIVCGAGILDRICVLLKRITPQKTLLWSIKKVFYSSK